MNLSPVRVDTSNNSSKSITRNLAPRVTRASIVKRLFRDLAERVRRLPKASLKNSVLSTKSFPFVLGESIAPLRTPELESDRVLMRGNLENLRRACRQLNGTLIDQNEVFSFWKQVGPPWRARGFRNGRRRSLNQVAGALFEAATRAQLKIIERHRSSEKLNSGLTPQQDAAVYWNCFDLRFSITDGSVLIEARMTPNELIVRLHGTRPLKNETLASRAARAAVSDSAEIAMTSGQAVVAKKPPTLPITADVHIKTAAILDKYEPEFESYLSGELIDLFLLPIRILRVLPGGSRFKWYVPTTSTVRTATITTLLRGIYSRWFAGKNDIEADTNLKTAEWLSRAFSKKIPYDVEHLIVAQEFLPFLWRMGALQGRTFDVLLTRPSLSVVHEKLDRAAELIPSAAKALGDYRAPKEIVEAEAEALVYADRVITPHEEFAHFYPNLRKLEWQKPIVEPPADVRRPRYLLFPTSLSTRDGAHAALAAADSLGLPLLVVGSDLEGLAVESDLVQFVTDGEIPWHEVAAVIHPTLFESWPRLHLHALAIDIPVIVTEAVGLEEGNGVTIVPFADEEEILRVLGRTLAKESDSRIRDPRLASTSRPLADIET